MIRQDKENSYTPGALYVKDSNGTSLMILVEETRLSNSHMVPTIFTFYNVYLEKYEHNWAVSDIERELTMVCE